MPKISDLPTDTAPATSDLIPFVDVDAARTESVTVANLAASAAFSDTYGLLAYAQAGSGAPNGVVTGSVGDRYIDTAATLGARVWYKASGTATNTGWLAAEGDTGWRNIASLATVPGAMTLTQLLLNRTGNVCSLIYQAALTDATNYDLGAIVPTGFRPRSLAFAAGLSGSGSFSAAHYIGVWHAGNIFVKRNIASSTSTYGVLSWLTTDAWPASLPGS